MEDNSTNPEKPAENEISDYYEGVKKLEMQGHESVIKKARNALFVAAGSLLLGEVISASTSGLGFTPLTIAIIVGEVAVFVGLGLWTKTKPFTAIIIGLIIYILLWILVIATADVKAAVSGIIIRIAIIGYLISAIKPAKAWEDAKKS